MKLLVHLIAMGAFLLPANILFAAEKKAVETKEAAKSAKDPHADHKREGKHHGHDGDCCDEKDCCKECDSSTRAGDHKDGKHSCCDDKDKAKECCKNCKDDKCKKACKSGHCKKGHCESKKPT